MLHGRRYVPHSPVLALWVLLSAAFALSLAIPLNAKPGDFDRSFGFNGQVVASMNGSISNAAMSTISGRILSVGSCPLVQSAASQPCVTAMTESGSVDTAFATSGVLRLGTTGTLNAIGVLRMGTVIVVGSCGFEFCAFAFDENGVLDANFGSGGMVTARFSSGSFFDIATAVVVNASGLTIVGKCNFGTAQSGWDFCVAKFHANGQLDGAYANQGKLRLSVSAGNGFDYADAAVETTDGAVAIFGTCKTDALGYGEICGVKVSATGVVDPTFGVSGTLNLRGPNVSTGTITRAANRRLDNTILISGTCNGAYDNAVGNSTFCSVLISESGVVNTNFGINGWFTYSPASGWFDAHSAWLQNDSKLLISGQCVVDNVSLYDFCVVRIGNTGVLDTGFGAAGFLRLPFSGATYESASTVHIDRRERAVLGGNCFYSSVYKSCFIRLHSRQAYFDLDNDNTTAAQTDAILYLRHLVGFHDTALTSGALGTYADRTSATDIATYLSTPNPTYPNCSASIVGAPGGPQAMLDGIVLLRAMMGLTGDAVTNGIAFPPGTTRTSWPDIKAHLNGNCGMALN